MAIRDMSDEEKFEVAHVAFGQTLLATSRGWSGYRAKLTLDEMRTIVNDVRKICDDMENAISMMEKRPVKELTPEEYEAKVAAGKKIKLAEGGKY